MDYDNQFLFYKNPLDEQHVPDSTLLDILISYNQIKTLFGEEFHNILKQIGNQVMNIPRMGSTNELLDKYRKSDGFENLLKNMKQLAVKITENFPKNYISYLDSFYRYYSELQIPFYLSQLLEIKKITFQPKNIGNNGKSCDNLIDTKLGKIFVEITSINTQNTKNIPTKILDIFEEKGQEQLGNNTGILGIDITASGYQTFDKSTKKIDVEFPMKDAIFKEVKKQLQKEENEHILAVIIMENTITTKNNRPQSRWGLTIKANEKHPLGETFDNLINASNNTTRSV